MLGLFAVTQRRVDSPCRGSPLGFDRALSVGVSAHQACIADRAASTRSSLPQTIHEAPAQLQQHAEAHGCREVSSGRRRSSGMR